MEDFSDPFYDGLTQEEREGVYLHILSTWAAGDNGGKRMTRAWKRERRDEWLLKRSLDEMPGVQEIKQAEAAALRPRLETLYVTAMALVDGIYGGEGRNLAIADELASAIRYRVLELAGIGHFAANPAGLAGFLCGVGMRLELEFD